MIRKGPLWHIQYRNVSLCIHLCFVRNCDRNYEKYHHRLSLSSFPSFSSRKYFWANLVSFMLVKIFESPSSQYRFNLSHPDWTTNSKEFSHPLMDGRALLCILLSFFGHRRLPTKKIPHWNLLHAFRLSKIESTIDHLPSRAHQKSTRSYHNGVSRHHPT